MLCTVISKDLPSAVAGANQRDPSQPQIRFRNEVVASLFSLASAMVAGQGIPGTLLVSPTGDDATAARGTLKPYQHIQDALDAALVGDTVLVTPGIYDEHLIWPDTDNIHLIGYGNDASLVIPSTPGPAITTSTAQNLFSITCRHIGFDTSSFNLVAIVIGDPATPIGSVLFDDVYAYGSTVDNVESVTALQCHVGYQTNFFGCDLIDAKDCYFDRIRDSFRSVAHPYGGTGSRLHRFRDVQASSLGGPAVKVEGCPLFDMDTSCNVIGFVDATALAPATSGSFLPLLRFGAEVRVVGAPSTNAVLLLVGFVGSMAGASNAPAGMDLSGCNVYGATSIALPTPLGAPLDSRVASFGATAAQLRGGLSVTGPGAGSRYLVSLRACRIGWNADDIAAPDPALLADGAVDVDARGCNLRNCALQAANGGAVDRDTYHAPFVAALAASGNIPILPPFPSYVGAVNGQNSYTVSASPTSPLASPVAVLPSSDHTHVDYVVSSPAGGASFLITRCQND